MHKYDDEFYRVQSGGSIRSARSIVPTLISKLSPKSVIDVGCGVGTWLSVFTENGVRDILGVDGPYVQRKHLLIPEDRFLAADLNAIPAVDRTFDLALCLEVAEHLPDSSADALVGFLTSSSNFVLFSAAIPFQGGEHHVNEQWPAYWHEKFSLRNFVACDIIRKHVWLDDNIEYWYRQNIILYIPEGLVKSIGSLDDESGALPLPLVHPAQYLQKCSTIANLEGSRDDLSKLILQLRSRVEELKDPTKHAPWNAFKFFIKTIVS